MNLYPFLCNFHQLVRKIDLSIRSRIQVTRKTMNENRHVEVMSRASTNYRVAIQIRPDDFRFEHAFSSLNIAPTNPNPWNLCNTKRNYSTQP